MERKLTPTVVETVQERLRAVPVRGLFFINGWRRPVVDRRFPAQWHETKDRSFQGETYFRSALMAPQAEVTLRQVFVRLAEAGLCCWLYSLCGEESLEYLASEDFDKKRPVGV